MAVTGAKLMGRLLLSVKTVFIKRKYGYWVVMSYSRGITLGTLLLAGTIRKQI